MHTGETARSLLLFLTEVTSNQRIFIRKLYALITMHLTQVPKMPTLPNTQHKSSKYATDQVKFPKEKSIYVSFVMGPKSYSEDHNSKNKKIIILSL